jgi:hypothetical protein
VLELAHPAATAVARTAIAAVNARFAPALVSHLPTRASRLRLPTGRVYPCSSTQTYVDSGGAARNERWQAAPDAIT